MITEMTDKCQWLECEDEATTIAQDREAHTLGCYCEQHALEVAERGNPEYTAECPNCFCLFGAN